MYTVIYCSLSYCYCEHYIYNSASNRSIECIQHSCRIPRTSGGDSIEGRSFEDEAAGGGEHHPAGDGVRDPHPELIRLGEEEEGDDSKAGADGGDPAIVPDLIRGRDEKKRKEG